MRDESCRTGFRWCEKCHENVEQGDEMECHGCQQSLTMLKSREQVELVLTSLASRKVTRNLNFYWLDAIKSKDGRMPGNTSFLVSQVSLRLSGIRRCVITRQDCCLRSLLWWFSVKRLKGSDKLSKLFTPDWNWYQKSGRCKLNLSSSTSTMIHYMTTPKTSIPSLRHFSSHNRCEQKPFPRVLRGLQMHWQKKKCKANKTAQETLFYSS